MNKIIITLIGTIILAFGCKSEKDKKGDNFSDCKYGAPTAVFASDLPTVATHKFELKSQVGFEEITFNNGLQLQLTQSGCNEIKQEFQFTLPDKPSADTPPYWVDQTRAQFNALGELGEKYLTLNFWAQPLEANREAISLGEPFELQPGFSIKIDRIIGSQNTLLLITLSGG